MVKESLIMPGAKWGVPPATDRLGGLEPEMVFNRLRDKQDGREITIHFTSFALYLGICRRY